MSYVTLGSTGSERVGWKHNGNFVEETREYMVRE